MHNVKSHSPESIVAIDDDQLLIGRCYIADSRYVQRVSINITMLLTVVNLRVYRTNTRTISLYEFSCCSFLRSVTYKTFIYNATPRRHSEKEYERLEKERRGGKWGCVPHLDILLAINWFWVSRTFVCMWCYRAVLICWLVFGIYVWFACIVFGCSCLCTARNIMYDPAVGERVACFVYTLHRFL